MSVGTRDAAPTATPALLPFVLASAAVSLIVATAVGWFVWSGRWAFLDDAYITMHSARVLWEGVDRSYPGTPALVGITSPVHLAIIALLLPAVAPETATLLTLWLATLTYGVGIGVLARAQRLSLLQAVGCTLIGLIVGFTPSQLANGLETALALALVTWVLVLASSERHRDGVTLYVLAGLAPFVRPEFALLSIAVGAARVVERPRDAGRALCVMGLSALPWAGWMFAQTGGVVPTTIRAKEAYFAESALPLSTKMRTALLSVAAFAYVIGALAVAVVGLWQRIVGRVGLVCAIALIAAYAFRFPSALHHYDGRYLYPLVPLLLFGLTGILRTHRVAGVVLLSFAIAHGLVLLSPRTHRYDEWSRDTAAARRGVSTWLLAHAEPGDRVLVHDAGFLSEHINTELVDLVGLKTPSSVAVHRRVTAPSGGRDRTRAVSEIMLREHTRYVVLSDAFVPGLDRQLVNLGWRVDQTWPADADDDAYYRVVRVTAPDWNRS